MFQNILGNRIKISDIEKKQNPSKLFLKILYVFLSKIINKNKLKTKYIAAYFATKDKPKNKPNSKKLIVEASFLRSKSLVIVSVQNNNNNKSVEIRKDEKLTAGIRKKLIEHSIELFLEKDKDKQSL
tara:strand:+ start:65 stop:445 length:381 start_codon:yes stop_codon:yes gene_type:complete